jgi:hypothetical protein
MNIFKTIIRRFSQHFGRIVVVWIIVPVVALMLLNLLMLLAAYIECYVFGEVRYSVWGCQADSLLQLS